MFPVNSPLFRFVLLAMTLIPAMGLRGQYEVSSWRDHYPYGEAREVLLAGDEVVGRTDFGLFAIDTASFELKRLTKGSPLSQSNPSAMAWDDTRSQLVVGYEDGGVDVLNDAGVVNVPDLRIAQRVGSKRINAIQIVDATVDAHLMYFDVSDELAIQVEPRLMNLNNLIYHPQQPTASIGLSLKLHLK